MPAALRTSKDRDKGEKGRGQGKSGGSAEHFADYCGKCGLWEHKQKNCRRQVNAVEEEQQQQQQQQQPPTDVGHLSATDTTGWIYTVVVGDRSVDESPEQMDESPDEDKKREVDESPKATEVAEEHEDERIWTIARWWRHRLERRYSEVTKVHRCADGRELRVYGYKWVKTIVGKTQQILQIRFTVLDVLRPIIALSCLVQRGWDLNFGGVPIEAMATHRGTQRRLGLIERTGLYFIPLLIAMQQVQHVRGHVIFSFEEEVAGDAKRQEHTFHESEEQEQQEAGEMKVPDCQ
eukprot:2151362-Amphidinium_carterae.1